MSIAILPSSPVRAAARDARITGVFVQASCASTPCVVGRDTPVRSDAVLTGVVEVHVEAKADLGLEWVRLEAQFPGNPRWFCLELWDAAGARSFSDFRRWNTTHWTDPRKGCRQEDCSHCLENSPHEHGALTQNIPHTLRVVAREQGGAVSKEPNAEGAGFAVRLQNAPQAPAWSSDPVSGGGAEGKPAVRLEWVPSDDPSLVEYRYVRVDPSGARSAFAVSASDPGAQGCQVIGAAAIRCVDESFSAGYGGEYRYAIVTVRRAFDGEPCKLVRGSCITSRLSLAKTVRIESARGTTVLPNASPSFSPNSSATPPSGGKPVAVAPPASQVGDALSASSHAPASKNKSAPLAIAGLLLVLVGAFGARAMMRRRARS